MFRRLHEDEDGMEALQVVVILTISFIALTLVMKSWPRIKRWFVTSVDEIIAWHD
jgi:hypothetical protein